MMIIIILLFLGLSYEGSNNSSAKAPISPVHSWAVVLHHVCSGKLATETLMICILYSGKLCKVFNLAIFQNLQIKIKLDQI